MCSSLITTLQSCAVLLPSSDQTKSRVRTCERGDHRAASELNSLHPSRLHSHRCWLPVHLQTPQKTWKDKATSVCSNCWFCLTNSQKLKDIPYKSQRVLVSDLYTEAWECAERHKDQCISSFNTNNLILWSEVILTGSQCCGGPAGSYGDGGFSSEPPQRENKAGWRSLDSPWTTRCYWRPKGEI